MSVVAPGKTVIGLIDSYIVEEALGLGAYGPTYVASTRMKRRVLLEEVHLGALDEWATLDVCLKEAALLKRLEHPNVVGVSELFGWDGEHPSPATRFAEPLSSTDTTHAPRAVSLIVVRHFPAGETLAAAVADGRHFSSDELANVMRCALSALSYLHALSPPIVHRRITAESLVVSDEGTCLAGVGLAPREAPDVAGDLRALARAVIFAASHVDATSLERLERTRGFDLRKLIPNLCPALRRALAASLSASASRGPASAREVLAILDGALVRPGALARRLRAIPRPVLRGAAATLAVGVVVFAVRGAGSSAHPSTEALVPTERADSVSLAASEGSKLTEGPTAPVCPAQAACAEPEACPACEVCTTEPRDAVPTPEALPTLTFATKVLRARGMDLGARCTLTVTGDAMYGDARTCSVSLACDTGKVLEEVYVTNCSLRETRMADGSARYEAWMTEPHVSGREDYAIVVDPALNKARLWRYDGADRVTADLTLHLDGASAPATAIALDHRAFVATTREVGVVTEVKGDLATAKTGQSCSITLEPTFDGNDNCDATIRCGSSKVYESSGTCTVDDAGKVTMFNDDSGSVMDGTPMVTWDGRGVTVQDLDTRGAYSIEIMMPKPKEPYYAEE